MRFRLRGLTIQIVAVHKLADSLRDEIWAFARRYTDATREGFFASLSPKRDAVLIRRRKSEELVGFGGVQILELACAGKLRTVIFPGDTLFDPKVRGKSLIQTLGFFYYLEARLRHPGRPIYMAYGTFSYKSYLMLRRNFRRYWPRPEAAMPIKERDFLLTVGQRTYGKICRIEADAIIVQASKRLHEHVAAIDSSLLADPDVRYFRERLPDFGEGRALLCLVPLAWDNWLHVFANALRRRRRAPAAADRAT